MLEALPVVASHVEEDDLLFWYDFQDVEQTLLRLSFSLNHRSVQTDLFVAGHLLVSVCQEGAVSLRIRPDRDGNNMLLGEFGMTLSPIQRAARARLEVRFSPHIEVNWSTLWDVDYGQLN